MNEFLPILKDQLLMPIATIIFGLLVYFVKKYTEQISRSILAKNEIVALEAENNMRMQALKIIADSTKSAVAFNMDTANKLKAEGRYLTEAEITQLNEAAMNLVFNSLPASITEEDGILLKLIGGKEKLIGLIKSYIERYVYEYKLQKPIEEKPKTEVNTTEKEQMETNTDKSVG